MGIPGFNTWFSTAHSRAYVQLKAVKIDHLYIDMNSVLHLVLRKGGVFWQAAFGLGPWGTSLL